jgi:glycine cleavage system H protein
MSELRYSSTHEWVRLEGDIATIGISDFAQGSLGDVVYVELPEVGREIEQGGEIAVVESVKAASEIYAPLAGTVLEVNEALAADPQLVNAEPTGAGWFFKMKVSDPAKADALLSEADYLATAEAH